MKNGFRLSMICSMLIAVISMPAGADEELLEVLQQRDSIMRQAIARQLQKSLNQQQTARLNYLMEIINDMRKICGLSNAQLRKLTVAAKGAVHYSLEGIHAQAEQIDQLDLAKLQAGQVHIQSSTNPASVADQPIWVKTLDKLLTAEQKESYETAMAHRIEAKREKLDQEIMARIAKFVPMSDEQHQKIAAIVSKQVDQDLKRRSARDVAALTEYQAISSLRDVLTKDFAPIFDKTQMVRWISFTRQDPRLRGFEHRFLIERGMIEREAILKRADADQFRLQLKQVEQLKRLQQVQQLEELRRQELQLQRIIDVVPKR